MLATRGNAYFFASYDITGEGLMRILVGVLMFNVPAPWLGQAVVIAVSNTVLELFSPRGTDDFTMATTNALICWRFGAFVR
jgi:hypothetical protein